MLIARRVEIYPVSIFAAISSTTASSHRFTSILRGTGRCLSHICEKKNKAARRSPPADGLPFCIALKVFPLIAGFSWRRLRSLNKAAQFPRHLRFPQELERLSLRHPSQIYRAASGVIFFLEVTWAITLFVQLCVRYVRRDISSRTLVLRLSISINNSYLKYYGRVLILPIFSRFFLFLSVFFSRH